MSDDTHTVFEVPFTNGREYFVGVGRETAFRVTQNCLPDSCEGYGGVVEIMKGTEAECIAIAKLMEAANGRRG